MDKTPYIASYFIKKALISSLLAINCEHNYNRRNTICIFSQPRGGSTWFSNLINTIPKSIKIDEPLFRGAFNPNGLLPPTGVGKIKDLDKLKFYYHQPIPRSEKFPEAWSVFHKLFSLKYNNPYLYEETSILDFFQPRALIVKFVEANLLIEWLIDSFHLKSIVLHRNPFSVVASQISFYAFEKVRKASFYKLPSFSYDEYFQPYSKILNEVKYPEEILAARWCLNYIPVSNYDDRWLTIFYEDLLTHPDAELKKLFNYLEFNIPKKLSNQFYKPAFKDYKEIADYKNVKVQLEDWKEKLDTEQIRRVRRILEKFGIDKYNGEAMSLGY